MHSLGVQVDSVCRCVRKGYEAAGGGAAQRVVPVARPPLAAVHAALRRSAEARAALLNVVSVSAWHRSSASLPGSLTGSQLKLPCLAPTSLA
jgi:hypothetical protein